MMKILFHLIGHLMSMDEFKLLIRILFFKPFLFNIHRNGERNTLHLYIHKLLKESFKKDFGLSRRFHLKLLCPVLITIITTEIPRHTFPRITESQNGRDWKRPLWVI